MQDHGSVRVTRGDITTRDIDAEIMAETVAEALELLVTICAFSAEDEQVYRRAVEEGLPADPL